MGESRAEERPAPPDPSDLIGHPATARNAAMPEKQCRPSRDDCFQGLIHPDFMDGEDLPPARTSPEGAVSPLHARTMLQ
ncbi:hypothetical protein [Komagataeibacter saccharivorans]|uniref:hypothetical protein n=1 Tax=Komagataeibacter saccharivorans TaxID=265959 RepID=UPI000C843E0A|nr:hypothetical protein [Komagataeibacter saccharivorans]